MQCAGERVKKGCKGEDIPTDLLPGVLIPHSQEASLPIPLGTGQINFGPTEVFASSFLIEGTSVLSVLNNLKD